MLLRLHRQFWDSSGYVLLTGSLFGAALVKFRVQSTGAPGYLFLNWNLFLAWVPYLCAVVLASTRLRWLRAVSATIWLAFFPNAPYLLTDFVHFRRINDAPWWYDVGLLAIFSAMGLFLALVSMAIVHRELEVSRWRRYSWPVIGLVSVLSGFGIYLGRFLRLNSWDIVTDPTHLLRNLRQVAMDSSLYPRVAGITVLFAALLLLCYIPLRQAGGRRHSG